MQENRADLALVEISILGHHIPILENNRLYLGDAEMEVAYTFLIDRQSSALQVILNSTHISHDDR